MRRLITIGAAAFALALPAGALAGNGQTYGSQPGYSQANFCGYDHGSFGYLGQDGTENRNLGQVGGYTGSVPGANGPATGKSNSEACGNPQGNP